MTILEMGTEDLDIVLSSPNPPLALKELKQNIKAKYRELALKYHPDKGGDHERMLELNNAYKQLMKLKLGMSRPQPTFSMTFSFSGTGTATVWRTF
jgi:hypothetical protein